MSRITKLVVGKGRTRRPSEAEEWLKEYFEVEVQIDDESEIEVARAQALGMIDGWLSIKTVAPVTPAPPTEARKVEHLEKRGKLLGRIVRAKDKITVLPIESLQVKTADPAIEHFLAPRVLEKLGVKYRLEDQQGILRAIIVEGTLSKEREKRLLNACSWAIQKASER